MYFHHQSLHQTLKSLLHAYYTELSGLVINTGSSPNYLAFGHKCLPEDTRQNLNDNMNGFRLKLYRAGELAKQKLYSYTVMPFG